jgi:AcrR family transcriptional regulator
MARGPGRPPGSIGEAGFGAQAGRLEPQSRRGLQTRSALVRGARKVFERDGYLDARITDIAAAAGTATGSFYTYFDGKEAIFKAVLDELNEEMLHTRLEGEGETLEPAAVVETANRAYLEAYRRNARLMRLLEQVAHTHEGHRRWRLERSRAFIERNAAGIQRWQAQGRADPRLDSLLAAAALSGMTSQLAYRVFVLGEEVPFEQLVATVTRLWVNALGLER